jgi:hypothetical protein
LGHRAGDRASHGDLDGVFGVRQAAQTQNTALTAALRTLRLKRFIGVLSSGF